MLILCIRTDQPEAEVGLYEDSKIIESFKWQAHRQLAETLHSLIEDLLSRHNKKLKDVEGIVCFGGPGSFTGLRIGMSVANALSYSLKVPIISAKTENNWPSDSIGRLLTGEDDKIGTIEYGSDPFVSTPKK